MALTTSQLFDVSTKTVLITGASGFLGSELVRLFALNGSKVILLGRSKKIFDVVNDVIASINAGGELKPYQVDFYNRHALLGALKEITREHSIDVLINNAYDMTPATGFNSEKGTLERLEHEHWQNSFESGLYAAFLLTQQIGASMKGRGGSIINVSSMYGVVAPSPELYQGSNFLNPASYSVMKSGMLGLTRYCASFWAQHAIRCNAVSPGPFSNTKGDTANSVAAENPFLKKVAERTLLKRVGKPEELNGIFLLLASDASSYITGQNFVVDGGWTVT